MKRKMNPEKMQSKKQHIADCAIKLFARKGFASAGIADIAKKAGIASGGVYNYFDDKSDIRKFIFNQVRIELGKKIDSVQDYNEMKTSQKLYNVSCACIDFFCDKPDLAQVFIRESVSVRNNFTDLFIKKIITNQSKEQWTRGNELLCYMVCGATQKLILGWWYKEDCSPQGAKQAISVMIKSFDAV